MRQAHASNGLARSESPRGLDDSRDEAIKFASWHDLIAVLHG